MSRLRKSSWRDVLSFFHSEEEKVCEHDSLERIKRRIDHLLVLFQLRGQLNIILVISTYSSYIGRPQFLHSHKHHLHLNHSLDLCGHSALVSCVIIIAFQQYVFSMLFIQQPQPAWKNTPICDSCSYQISIRWGCWHFLLYGLTLCVGEVELYRGLLQKKMVLECFKKNNFFL